MSELLQLSIIHFARRFIIRRDQWPGLPENQRPANDYMFFASNFNGTWDQYIDGFSDGIPNGLDLFWHRSIRYPGFIPITAFKNYIRLNQIDCSCYYNATPGSGQRDIKSALRVWTAIDTLIPMARAALFPPICAGATHATCSIQRWCRRPTDSLQPKRQACSTTAAAFCAADYRMAIQAQASRTRKSMAC